MRPLVLVVLAALASGCASEEGGFAFARKDALLDPYFMEYREVVAGAHSKGFDVPVDSGANLVNVTVALDARTNGLPVPERSPTRLTVRLVDPAGVVLQEAALGVQAPVASLVLADAAPGLYHAQVEGFGASQELGGETYGSGYVLTIDVGYT